MQPVDDLQMRGHQLAALYPLGYSDTHTCQQTTIFNTAADFLHAARCLTLYLVDISETLQVKSWRGPW